MTDLLTRAPSAPPLDAALPAELGTAFSGTVAESLAVVVAPTTGRFRPLDGLGEIRSGQLIGHVTGGRGRADEVRSPVDAVLRSLLVRPGQLVSAGQGLAWLQRMGRRSA